MDKKYFLPILVVIGLAAIALVVAILIIANGGDDSNPSAETVPTAPADELQIEQTNNDPPSQTQPAEPASTKILRSDSRLPENWSQLNLEQKIELNPYYCSPDTNIDEDTGYCSTKENENINYLILSRIKTPEAEIQSHYDVSLAVSDNAHIDVVIEDFQSSITADEDQQTRYRLNIFNLDKITLTPTGFKTDTGPEKSHIFSPSGIGVIDITQARNIAQPEESEAAGNCQRFSLAVAVFLEPNAQKAQDFFDVPGLNERIIRILGTNDIPEAYHLQISLYEGKAKEDEDGYRYFLGRFNSAEGDYSEEDRWQTLPSISIDKCGRN